MNKIENAQMNNQKVISDHTNIRPKSLKVDYIHIVFRTSIEKNTNVQWLCSCYLLLFLTIQKNKVFVSNYICCELSKEGIDFHDLIRYFPNRFLFFLSNDFNTKQSIKTKQEFIHSCVVLNHTL
jgi:hypothetical protein